MLDWIVNTVTSLGYVGIALLMFLENVFPPIPSELIMPLAGFVVTQGKLQFPLVILSGTIGSILGTLPWYYLGKTWSLKRIKRFADRYGKWFSLSGKDVEKTNKWFDKRGNVATCIGRLVPAIRTYISVPAGIGDMNLGLFLFYSTIGTVVWVSLLTYAGYLLGANYDRVKEFVSPISTIVIILLVFAFIFWVIKRKKKEKKK